MPTVLIAVGVSRYADERISSLPGATSDVRRVVNAFTAWGIDRSHVRTLFNEEAQRSNVLAAFRSFKHVHNAPKRLIFYFAGHGISCRGATDTSDDSRLLTYESSSDSLSDSGISLNEILLEIQSIHCSQVFLFLDACSLQLNQVFCLRPPTHSQLSNSVQTNLLGNGGIAPGIQDAEGPIEPPPVIKTGEQPFGLFCLLSSGLEVSYEDSTQKMGYFTQAMLLKLSELRHQRFSQCGHLAEAITKDFAARHLPLPESYHIGSHTLWPLPRVSALRPRFEKDFVIRQELIAHLQDLLVTNSGSVVAIYGEGGVGKSAFARHLSSLSDQWIYCSVALFRGESAEKVIEELASSIAKRFPHIFDKGRPLPGIAIKTLYFFAEMRPDVTLMIDHFERLEEEVAGQILDLLLTLNCSRVIISRHAISPVLQKKHGNKLVLWEFPPFSIEDTETFLAHYAKGEMPPELQNSFGEATLLTQACRGNPLKLRAVLSEEGQSDATSLGSEITSHDLKNVIAALYICGGFIEEEIFLKEFDIDPDLMVLLEKLGLLYSTSEGCFPHDLLYESEDVLVTEEFVKKAISYWSKQVEKTPYDLFACRSLMVLAKFYLPLFSGDGALRQGIRRLRGQENLIYLSDLAQSMIESSWETPATLDLAEALIEITSLENAGKLIEPFLKIRSPKVEEGKKELFGEKEETRLKALAIEAERLWWVGRFDESVQTAEIILAHAKPEQLFLRCSAFLSRGISLFFLGSWESAIQDMSQILAHHAAIEDVKILSWTQLILGTILGIRGTDIERGQALIEDSIRLLEKSPNSLWLAMCYANLGEIMWKIGNYRKSLVCLYKACDYADLADNRLIRLESQRNICHVFLRLRGPFSSELTEALAKIFELSSKEHEDFEQMQILNTLATIYAYRSDRTSLRQTLAEVRPLTEGNKEYEIYTIANQSLLYLLEEDMAKAKESLDQSIKLAEEGGNQLAIKQIQADYDYVLTREEQNRKIG